MRRDALGPDVVAHEDAGPFVILVVEDEVLIRFNIAEHLRLSGFVVLEAASASEARSILSNAAIDLVFSDINMPGAENGVDLAKWIADNIRIPVVLTSAINFALQDASLSSAPVAGFLEKPYDNDSVEQHLRDILTR